MSKDSQHLQQSANDNLLFLLINTARHAKSLIKKHIEALHGPYNPASFELLSQLDFKGNNLSQLTERLQCSKQETTRIVQQAVDKGWVTVNSAEDDRRKKVITLSAQGQQLLADGFKLYEQLQQQLLQSLDSQQQQQIKTLLRQLNKDIKQQLA